MSVGYVTCRALFIPYLCGLDLWTKHKNEKGNPAVEASTGGKASHDPVQNKPELCDIFLHRNKKLLEWHTFGAGESKNRHI